MFILPPEERYGEVAFIWAGWTADVQLSLVPNENMFGPQQDGSIGVGNYKLSCRKRTLP